MENEVSTSFNTVTKDSATQVSPLQVGVDKLVKEDLSGILEMANPAVTTAWIRSYVGLATRDKDVNFHPQAVLNEFERKGYTADKNNGRNYDGSGDSNAVQNLLVALSKGQLPNPFSLTRSPKELAEEEEALRKFKAPPRKPA